MQSFKYDEVPKPATSYPDQEEDAEVPPPLPPPRGTSLVPNDKTLPTIPTSASAQEYLDREARNNSENLERSRNVIGHERPLPPLPRRDGSLEKVDESENGSDTDEDIDEVDSDDDDISDVVDDDDDDENTPIDLKKSRLSNGNSVGRENDEGFNADSTLPPSPSKTSNTSGFNSISSLESPPTPDSDR